jgi:hypothetical protein
MAGNLLRIGWTSIFLCNLFQSSSSMEPKSATETMPSCTRRSKIGWGSPIWWWRKVAWIHCWKALYQVAVDRHWNIDCTVICENLNTGWVNVEKFQMTVKWNFNKLFLISVLLSYLSHLCSLCLFLLLLGSISHFLPCNRFLLHVLLLGWVGLLS